MMPDGSLILEGIVTSLNDDTTVNVSPMGPSVDRDITRLRLRPYKTSRTYRNLKRHGEGIFHVTDDVDLIARCAVGQMEPLPPMSRSSVVEGSYLTDACRWYAFRVQRLEDQDERTTIDCEVIGRARLRDFFGFNRAKHAVVEAAILATRVERMDADQISAQFKDLAVWVEKTGGDQERRAMAYLQEYVNHQLKMAERS